MKPIELVLTAIALSMDAFAVAICKGLSMKKADLKQSALVGGYFGFFQGFMPLIGYFLGSRFEPLISGVDHWIVFILLGIIGFNMVRESMSQEEAGSKALDLTPRAMFPLAVATSIDALAVGITFAILHINILPAVLLIGGITFVLSVAGVKIGNLFGSKYKSRAELFGGIVLVLIGGKILLEHTGFLS